MLDVDGDGRLGGADGHGGDGGEAQGGEVVVGLGGEEGDVPPFCFGGRGALWVGNDELGMDTQHNTLY